MTDNSIILEGKRNELYYFAYGSNMNAKQIRDRCHNPKVVGIAKLPDYQIAFFDYAKPWDGALETVLETPGHDVWGVIYEMNPSNRESLDLWHGARLDGTGAYFHYPVVLTDTTGVTRMVLLYKKDRLGEPTLPSKEYVDFIVEGALEHGLPAEYVEELRQIPSKPAGYPVPVRKSGRDFLAEGSCSGCSD